MVAVRQTITATSPAAEPQHAPPGRLRRAAALAVDVATAIAAQLIAALVAVVWLLVATDAGRFDPTPRESNIALAILAAAGPAWYAWQVVLVCTRGATAGQRLLGERVVGSGWRALLRLALHPLSLVAWLWLASYAAVLGFRLVAVLALVAAAAWAGLGLATAAMVLMIPAARPLHDRLAGTRLLRR